MSELRSAYSPVFKEIGFETRIAWNVSRREFAQNLKRLFEELRKNHAAIPLPVASNSGLAACILAGIDCRSCTGLCCNRGSQHVSLFPSEALKLEIEGTPDSRGQISMALPCKFIKKGQCSIYSDRPARCRLYPIQIGGNGTGTSAPSVVVGLDSYCPESLRLGLRIYMTSYDLAHGMKEL